MQGHLLAGGRECPGHLQPALLTEDEPQLARRPSPSGCGGGRSRTARVRDGAEQVLSKEALSQLAFAARVRRCSRPASFLKLDARPRDQSELHPLPATPIPGKRRNFSRLNTCKLRAIYEPCGTPAISVALSAMPAFHLPPRSDEHPRHRDHRVRRLAARAPARARWPHRSRASADARPRRGPASRSWSATRSPVRASPGAARDRRRLLPDPLDGARRRAMRDGAGLRRARAAAAENFARQPAPPACDGSSTSAASCPPAGPTSAHLASRLEVERILLRSARARWRSERRS